MKDRASMGFWSVLGLTIGAQLGTGMFLLPAQLSPYGIWGLFSWIATGTGALILSLIFSILARYHPEIGGPQVYVHTAFGKQAAFATGWMYWIISWLSSVPVIMVYTGALEHLCGPFTGTLRVSIQSLTLLVLMTLNLRGAFLAGIGEICFSLLKIVPLILIPLWVLISIPLHSFPETQISPMKALHEATLLGFWGYIGLECGTTVSNYVRNPSVTIPKALCIGSLLVTLVYVLNTGVIINLIPLQDLLRSSSPYSELLSHTLGPIGGRLMSALIAIMCLGTLNSWILTSGQIAVIAAQEKLFPSFFSRYNRYNSPFMGVIITTFMLLLCVLCLQSRTLNEQLHLLINLSVSLFILVYIICVAAFLMLLYKKVIPFKKGFLILGILGLLFCLWTFSGVDCSLLAGSFIIPLSGFILKALFKW